MDIILALCTAPSPEKAAEIANVLLAEKLAACVNVLPGVTSHYWWQGKIEQGTEVLMIIKAPKAKLKQLEARLLELHPYDTAEFVVLDPQHVSPKYAAWIKAVAG